MYLSANSRISLDMKDSNVISNVNGLAITMAASLQPVRILKVPMDP